MPSTNFAILRVERVKTVDDLKSATRHGKRTGAGTHFDPARTRFNLHWSACQVVDPVDWEYGVTSAIARVGATLHQGASVAAEFLVSASPEYFDPPEGSQDIFDVPRVMQWAEATMDAFYERYGKAVVAARLDLDEGSPHMAICILPTYVKETKHKRALVVSYRQVFGGDKDEARDKLIELQDWYAGKMWRLGLERGLPAKLTRRGHLTHQQYARKKQQEDQDRENALSEAREHADRMRRALEDIDAKVTTQVTAEAAAIEMRNSAAALLEDAKKVLAFLTQASTLIQAYDPHAPMAALLVEKEPTFARAKAFMDRLTEDLDDIEIVTPAGPAVSL